jgi:hypothetical protein
MELPGFRNRKIAGTKIESAVIRPENNAAGFDKKYFNAFIPMAVAAPVLRPGRIPKTNAVHARQGIAGNSYSPTMAVATRRPLDFTSSDCQNLRLTRIHD